MHERNTVCGYNPFMRFFLRIIALLLVFTLPVYGFAGISKDCSQQGMEQATLSAPTAMVMDGGFDVGPDSHAEKMGLDKFEFGFSCSASDGGQQCQMGILPSSLALAAPVVASPPFVYTKSFAQVFLEQPQRPPLAA
jgi:hypothetical protein